MIVVWWSLLIRVFWPTIFACVVYSGVMFKAFVFGRCSASNPSIGWNLIRFDDDFLSCDG